MITEQLRKVVEQLAILPDDEQHAYAEQIAIVAHEHQRSAAQRADTNETDLEALLRRADEQSAESGVYDLDSTL
jgi:predicted ATPase